MNLPGEKRSGLVEIQKVLTGVEGIAFVYLNSRDVIRHELVQRIIKAYEQYEKESKERRASLRDKRDVVKN